MTASLSQNTNRNFFVTGGTLQHDARSYVARKADDELYNGLRRGEFCYVLTPRQMGKSSLMVRTAARLREAGLNVAVLDLTAIGQNLSPEQWYGGLLSQLGQQLALEDELLDFWAEHERFGPLQRWLRAIRQIVLPRRLTSIVIFVDEIDAVRSLPFSTDEFFAGIRELHNERTTDAALNRLTFCLLGVAAPSDLIQDTRTTPFNVGRRIELLDFTAAEASQLAQGLGDKSNQAVLERVLYWTGGHPYLTQRLCQAIAETKAQSPDRLCEELFFSKRARERDDNLLFVRERMLRSEADLAGLLTLYHDVRRGKRVEDDESNPLISVLRLTGVTRTNNSRLHIRNRIYEHVFDSAWVMANMPDAEIRRQRAAYRRGLLRATLAAGAIIFLVASLAALAFQQRNRANEQRARAEHQEQANRRLLYNAQMNLAQQAWEGFNVPRVLELLGGHFPAPDQPDMRGFEWFYLWRLCHRDLYTWPHNEAVYAVAFSPDGKTLATGGGDNLIHLWDAEVRQEIKQFKGHENWVECVAFSPDGQWLATGSDDQTVRLWDVATGRELAVFKGHTNTVRAAVFSPDGQTLATASEDDTARLWDVAAQRERALLQHGGDVIAAAFTPDGQTVATVSWDKTVKLWETTTGKWLEELKSQGDRLVAVAFSPDGRTLAAGSDRHIVRLWQRTSWGQWNEVPPLKGHTSYVYAVAFASDGKTLASASSDRSVKLWETTSWRDIGTLVGHTDETFAVAFSPNGAQLLTGSADKTAKLWRVAQERESVALAGHTDTIRSVAFSPDGKTLASGGDDQTARLWDTATEQLITTLNGHRNVINGVAFAPDGNLFATGSTDHTAKLWDATTGRELATLQAHTDQVRALAFSPDGKWLATGSYDKAVRLWEVATRQSIVTLNGSMDRVTSLAFSPDGKILAAGCGTDFVGQGNIIVIWNLDTRKEIVTLKKHADQITTLAFSPDGLLLATGSEDKTVRLWNTSSWKEIATLKGHTGDIERLSFSPDGRRLVTASTDKTVRLWDTTLFQELLALKGHGEMIYAVAFSPDGRALATAGRDHTVRLWRAANEIDVNRQNR